MTQRKIGLIVCMLLLSTAVGCSKATPEAKTSPSAGDTSSTAAVPSTGTASPTAANTQVNLKKIQGNGVELSVPTDYEGGNPSTDLDTLSKKLTAINPKYDKALEPLKKNPSAVAFLAFDVQSAKTGQPTNVNITKQKAPPGLTVEQAMNKAAQQLQAPYQVLEQKVVPLDKYQAGRILAQVPNPNPKVKQLFYIIKNADTFWVLTYVTSADKFDQLLPTFEQSARTFNVKS